MSLLALGLLAAQGLAPGDQVTFDIHCMIASQAANEQAEGEMKAATLLSTCSTSAASTRPCLMPRWSSGWQRKARESKASHSAR